MAKARSASSISSRAGKRRSKKNKKHKRKLQNRVSNPYKKADNNNCINGLSTSGDSMIDDDANMTSVGMEEGAVKLGGEMTDNNDSIMQTIERTLDDILGTKNQSIEGIGSENRRGMLKRHSYELKKVKGVIAVLKKRRVKLRKRDRNIGKRINKQIRNLSQQIVDRHRLELNGCGDKTEGSAGGGKDGVSNSMDYGEDVSNSIGDDEISGKNIKKNNKKNRNRKINTDSNDMNID